MLCSETFMHNTHKYEIKPLNMCYSESCLLRNGDANNSTKTLIKAGKVDIFIF